MCVCVCIHNLLYIFIIDLTFSCFKGGFDMLRVQDKILVSCIMIMIFFIVLASCNTQLSV